MNFVPPHTLIEKALAESGILPPAATTGPYPIGSLIMVKRDSIHASVRNPDLPEWFPAIVCMPPSSEPGNWYRWYDPYIWYETEADLSNGGDWCNQESRGKAYTGKIWYASASHRDFWAMPVAIWREAQS